MLQGLGAPRGALVVMDAGIATAENILWLRTQGYRYLVVSRERQRQFDAAAATSLTTASGEALAIQRVVDTDAEEVRLYCFSECRAGKEQGISERFTTRFETDLQALHDGLARPRTTKTIDKLWERIGRLKAKSHGVGQHDVIEIVPDATGKTAQAIRWERQPVAGTMLTHPGVYCLHTNEMTWDAERLWRTYVTLTDLEGVFPLPQIRAGLAPGLSPHRGAGRRPFVYLGPGLSVRPTDSSPLAGAGDQRPLVDPARHPRRAVPGHHHLPPCRRAHLVCAQGAPSRTGAVGDHSGAGQRSQPGRDTENGCLSRPVSQNCTAVVPLTDFFRNKRMILREK
jgi:hypothetical protein